MDLTKEKFISINNKMCKKYSNLFLSLREEYSKEVKHITINKFIFFNKKYRDYIIQLIKEIISLLNQYYNIEYCITVSGSLARYSNTLFSDIDINYLTINNDYHELIDLEDKTNYILKNVLKFRGKDRIHSMVVYLPLISDVKLTSISNNKYPLVFDDGIIYDYCRDNAEQLMYETYNSTRNLVDVLHYFNTNDTYNRLNEWTYCFECIYNDEIFNTYMNERIIYRKDKGINNLIKQLMKEFEDNEYLDNNVFEVRNAYLKKIYKSSVLFDFYKVMALVYRLDNSINNFNLDDFYKNGRILNKKIYYYFYKYLIIIQNIQYILDMENKDLSSHSDEIININDFNSKYQEFTGRKAVIKDLNYYKKKLYDCINDNLKGVEQWKEVI